MWPSGDPQTRAVSPLQTCGRRFRAHSSLLFHQKLAHQRPPPGRRRRPAPLGGGGRHYGGGGEAALTNGWCGESSDDVAGPLATPTPTLAAERHQMTVVGERAVVTLVTGVSAADGRAVALYRCHLCAGSLFGSLGSLQRHLAGHAGDDAGGGGGADGRRFAFYPCGACDAAFRFRTHLRRHLATRHRVGPAAERPGAAAQSLASQIRERARLTDDVTVVIPADAPDDSPPDDARTDGYMDDDDDDDDDDGPTTPTSLPPPLIDVIGAAPAPSMLPQWGAVQRAAARGSRSPPDLSPMTGGVKREEEEEMEEDEEEDGFLRGHGASLSKTHSRSAPHRYTVHTLPPSLPTPPPSLPTPPPSLTTPQPPPRSGGSGGTI